jgi:hypothetical protein
VSLNSRLSIWSIVAAVSAALMASPVWGDDLTFKLPPGAQLQAAIDQLPADQRSAMNAAAAETFPLFLFVPGVMGSRLTKTLPDGRSEVIWGRADGVFSNPNQYLKYDDSDQVKADPLDDYYIFNQAFDVYGKAMDKLSYLDLSAGNSIRKFAYDWRQSNAKSARDFSAWLCANQTEFRKRPLVLIAHSMGGLVVKSWLKDIYKSSGCAAGDTFAGWAKITRIIFLGTPHYGAPKSLVAFGDKYSLFIDGDDTTLNAILGGIDAATFSKSLNSFGATFPSAYELLPIVNTNKCFRADNWPYSVFVKSTNGSTSRDIDLFNVDTWKLFKWPKTLDASIDRSKFMAERLNILLESARDFACGVSHYRPEEEFRVVWISGMRRKTVCEVTIKQPATPNQPATVDTKMCDEGDGTVPKWIASEKMYSTADTSRTASEGHVHLVGSTEFLDYLDDYRDELHRDMQRRYAAKTGKIDGLVTLYASVHAAVPSIGNDPNDVTAQTARAVIAALDVQPDQLFATALATADPLTRANAYRIFADVAKKNDQRRAWALSNSAHIYLNRNGSVAAFDLGKRALAAGVKSNAGKDFVRKSGSITALAAEQLGDLKAAGALRDLSMGRISSPPPGII